MPAEFYFTEMGRDIVGGRFRKPQLIEPRDIALVMNEMFSDWSRATKHSREWVTGKEQFTKALSTVLKVGNEGGIKELEEEVKKGTVQPVVLTADHLACTISFPSGVRSGIGRKVKIAYKKGWFEKDIFEREHSLLPNAEDNRTALVRTHCFDLQIKPKQVGYRRHGNPMLKVTHIIPLKSPHGIGELFNGGYSHFSEFLEDYRKYLELASSGIAEEILGQKQTEVHLDLEPLMTFDSMHRERNQKLGNRLYWLFYEKLKDGTMTRLLKNRGYDLTPKLPSDGERFEVEDECQECGSLERTFGKCKDNAEVGKTTTNHCYVCGGDVRFKVFYSRPLSSKEAEHFSSMAVLAADSAD